MIDLLSLWEQIDDIVNNDKKYKYDTMIQNIKGILKSNINNADLYYALGYILYMHPKRRYDKKLQIEVVDTFAKVLAINAEYHLANLYLGHHFYDIGNFSQALLYFEKVDIKHIDNLLANRLQELVVCCKIKLDHIEKCEHLIDWYIDISLKSDENDVFPSFLVDVVIENIKPLKNLELKKTISNKMIKLLSDTDQGFVFSKELDFFKEFTN